MMRVMELDAMLIMATEFTIVRSMKRMLMTMMTAIINILHSCYGDDYANYDI